MRSTALEIVRDAGGLHDTSEDVLSALVGRFRVRHVDAGAVLCGPGHPGRAVWIVVTGRCTCSFAGDEGHVAPPGPSATGRVFGHVGVFTGEPRHLACRALDASTLLELGGPDADALLLEPGPVGTAWRSLLIHALSHQIADADLAFLRPPAPTTPRTLP